MPMMPMQGQPQPQNVSTAGGPPQGQPQGAPNGPKPLDPAAIANLSRALTPDVFQTFMQVFGAVMMDAYHLIQQQGKAQMAPPGAGQGKPQGIMGGAGQPPGGGAPMQGGPPGAGGAGGPPPGMM